MMVWRIRTLVVAIGAVAAIGAGACTSTGGGESAATVVLGPTKEGLPTILVVSPVSGHTQVVWESLRDELQNDFNVARMELLADTSAAELSATVRQIAPKCLVLMNNSALGLWRDVQRENPKAQLPPSIIVMTSFLEDIIGSVRAARGIAYEVPGVTSFARLRGLLERPIKKVGVIYRPQFRRFIARQTELSATEKLLLQGFEVSERGSVAEIRRGIIALMETERVDALWILNDNRLLRRELMAEAWIPMLPHEVPVVVGVESLVQSEPALGTFAMVPDPKGLGLQAANIVFELADQEWKIETNTVEQPLAVRSMVNLREARQHLPLNEEMLGGIDMVIE